MTATKALILKTAAALAVRRGFRNVTREEIAGKAEIAAGTVSYHFKSMSRLQDAVMVYAVNEELLPILAQGLAEKHRVAQGAAVHLRQRAAQLIV